MVIYVTIGETTFIIDDFQPDVFQHMLLTFM